MLSAGNKMKMGNGYTLIEVLVSLAILMFSLTVIGRLMRSSMMQTLQSEEETEVQIVCRNTMDSILAGALAIAPQQKFSMPGFSDWEIEIACVQGTLPGITEIFLIAQKYETPDNGLALATDSDDMAQQSSDQSTGPSSGRIPISARRIILKQWAQTSTIRLSGKPLSEAPKFNNEPISPDAAFALEARIGDGTLGSGARAEDINQNSESMEELPNVFVPDQIETTDFFGSPSDNFNSSGPAN